MNANGRHQSICLIAWEVSGDQNAGRLAAEIRRIAPEVRLFGAGGRQMTAAGVDVQEQTTDTHFMGVPESLAAIKKQIGVFRRVMKLAIAATPDLVVLVDNETTNLLLARQLRRRGLRVVFFFPPQVWFWGRWRIPRVVRLARRVISAFREEAQLYRDAGADVVWAGHPLSDEVSVPPDAARHVRAIGLDPARPIVAIMPGSRAQEVRALAPAMLDAARMLHNYDPRLQFALPLANPSLRDEIERALARSGVREVAIYEPRSYAVLSQARAVLLCSGTAAMETALLGIPSVVAYRCNPIAYFVATRLMHVRFISIVNILLGEMVQPEFFQRNVDGRHLFEALSSLIYDEEQRAAARLRLEAVKAKLGPAGASFRAAEAVVDLLAPGAEILHVKDEIATAVRDPSVRTESDAHGVPLNS